MEDGPAFFKVVAVRQEIMNPNNIFHICARLFQCGIYVFEGLFALIYYVWRETRRGIVISVDLIVIGGDG